MPTYWWLKTTQIDSLTGVLETRSLKSVSLDQNQNVHLEESWRLWNVSSRWAPGGYPCSSPDPFPPPRTHPLAPILISPASPFTFLPLSLRTLGMIFRATWIMQANLPISRSFADHTCQSLAPYKVACIGSRDLFGEPLFSLPQSLSHFVYTVIYRDLLSEAEQRWTSDCGAIIAVWASCPGIEDGAGSAVKRRAWISLCHRCCRMAGEATTLRAACVPTQMPWRKGSLQFGSVPSSPNLEVPQPGHSSTLKHHFLLLRKRLRNASFGASLLSGHPAVPWKWKDQKQPAYFSLSAQELRGNPHQADALSGFVRYKRMEQ